MSSLSLLVRHQANKEGPSKRPPFQDSMASCLLDPGGRWECAALKLLPYYVLSTLVSQPHGPLSSQVNLFLVQLFAPLCYVRKVNMNYS